jgi:hypothetical protein
MTTNFLSPLSFVAVLGSGIRDPGSGIRDKHPGSATLVDTKLKQSSLADCFLVQSCIVYRESELKFTLNLEYLRSCHECREMIDNIAAN